ncbi:unnamed protein product [Didymodactylos carnosus]|uniref:Death domain-containing protein n=1 Tax=Didymodactylos carnosus TaxID=1234261 RepID=A0A816A319_9BILA|nr:unnamed protein product [Didymodactylos carnosus]CAF4462047.1 unnamed protein product [Didymodactylos carnosus]
MTTFFAHYRQADSYRTQTSKLDQEYDDGRFKREELEYRLGDKDRLYLSKRLTYEVYQEQCEKMIKHPDQYVESKLSIEKFQQEIKQFEKELPKLQFIIDTIKARLNYFEQRKEEIEQMKRHLKQLDSEVQTALENKILKENELNRVERCLHLMKQIHRFRSSNDLVQKIYYDIPVKSKNNKKDQNGNIVEEDELSKALRLISQSIGRDWNRLYWQLPFYPCRGNEEKSNDIKHIDHKYHRGDVYHHQAIDCLTKWRRYHTRAKMDDILIALAKIRRYDLVQVIQKRILKQKRQLDYDVEDIDPRKKEIEDLNKKLNKLFEKIKNGQIQTHETYVYSSLGCGTVDPVRKYHGLSTH